MLPRPTIRQIEMFLRLAESGSFGLAAEQLKISQSGLSQSITQIEFVLGIKLFDRTTRQVKLTQAGAQFRPRAERLLAEYELAIEDLDRLADPRKGRVSVACLSSIAVNLIPQAIAAFRARFPNVTISIKDDNSFGVVNRLKAGEVDFALGSAPHGDAELSFTPLLPDRFGIVCQKDHPFAGRHALAWADLQSESYVAFSPETATAALLRSSLQGDAALPRARYEAFHLATILGMVERGLGVAVLPYLAYQHGSGSLCYRHVDNPVIERELGIISLAGRSPTAAAREFRDCLVAQVQSFSGEVAGIDTVGSNTTAPRRPRRTKETERK